MGLFQDKKKSEKKIEPLDDESKKKTMKRANSEYKFNTNTASRKNIVKKVEEGKINQNKSQIKENINNNKGVNAPKKKDLSKSFNKNLNINKEIKIEKKEIVNTIKEEKKINLQNDNIINNKIGENPVEINKIQDNDKSNIKEEVPTNCIFFEKINIFNSILIMMSNISILKDYFKKDTFIILYKQFKNNPNYLTNILYDLYNYLWNYNNKSLISEKDLLNKCMDFLKINSICPDPINFCNDTNNLIAILEIIYTQINVELTSEKKKLDQNKSQNNSNDFKMNSLSSYINNVFSLYNKSKISDYFIGFNLIKTICKNCQSISQSHNLNNDENNYTEFNFDFYYYLYFNIDEINNNIITNRQAANNQYFNTTIDSIDKYNYIDLVNCFEYIYNENSKQKIAMSTCGRCNLYTYINQNKNIYTLPRILTIVLKISDNYNFFLLDELNLKQFAIDQTIENIYYIVSILCQLMYNKKYICYCINPSNGLWYSYSDGEIKEVKKMDINAIPLIIIYQSKELKIKYNSLQRDDFEKYCLKIRFTNGLEPLKLVFRKDELIANVIKKIALYAKTEVNNIKLMYNGSVVPDDKKLNEVINKSENVAIITARI